MDFGFQSNTGGEFLPLLTYSAKDGRFTLQEKVEQNGNWVKDEALVPEDKFAFAMDLATIKKGWLLFRKAQQPLKTLVNMTDPFPPEPRGDFGINAQGKPVRCGQGFVVHVMGADKKLREFSSNAQACVAPLMQIVAAYYAAPEKAQGMIPVVKIAKMAKVDKHGNWGPTFEIARYIPRPETFGEGPAVTYAPPAAPPAGDKFGFTPGPAPAAAASTKAMADLNDEVPF